MNRKDLSLPICFFATDLHGRIDRYDKLLASIVRHLPAAVFLGGDLLPRSVLSATQFEHGDFVHQQGDPGDYKSG
jgi:Icc-related predicted phosphoesterase